MYNYCSRLVNTSLIKLSEFNKQILDLINITDNETPGNSISSSLSARTNLPDCLLYKPIYLNGKYSLGFTVENKYFHIESKKKSQFKHILRKINSKSYSFI